ncbi:hypothetical protein Btru_063918, partial [Bulinus truncatus]
MPLLIQIHCCLSFFFIVNLRLFVSSLLKCEFEMPDIGRERIKLWLENMMSVMMCKLIMLIGVIASATPTQITDSVFIDLSHPQSSTTIYWPGQPRFNRTVVQKGSNSKNIWIEVGAFTSGEHGGTHIDAPRHFYPKGYDLKDLPLERTVAKGVMVDARPESGANIDYKLTVEKLVEWENVHGRIPPGAAVVINFGWTSRWPNPLAFFGTENSSDDT